MQILQSLTKVNVVFASFTGVSTILQKLMYIACCLGVLAFLSKYAAGMGLIPIHSADWIGVIPQIKIKESSAFNSRR